GARATYANSEGFLQRPVTDTATGFTCPSFVNGGSGPASEGRGETTVSLVDGRFRVSARFEAQPNVFADAIPGPLTERSAYFSTFQEANVQLMMKLVPNPETGFTEFLISTFAASRQRVGIFDVCNVSFFETNLLADVPDTVENLNFFPLVCVEVFSDAFESGTLSAWSSSAG
ncbi:MAG: hypothetical protein AAF725_26140, partial [Acidobacteriota bacterium]